MPNGMAGKGGNQGMNGGGPALQRGPETSGPTGRADEPEPSPDEVDAARTREITAKAMTGILVLLLKWLRVSREFGEPEADVCRRLTPCTQTF